MTRDAIAWVTRESLWPRATIAWDLTPLPPEKPRRVCAKKGCRRLVPPAANGANGRIYCTPEHCPRQPIKPSRRVCAREGCRRWWMTDMKRRGESARKYCTPAHSRSVAERYAKAKKNPDRRRAQNEARRAVRWDRIGDLRADDEPMQCVKCLKRRARKRFTFCLPCSFCERCGVVKPRSGASDCAGCSALASERKRVRYATDPVVRDRDAARGRLRTINRSQSDRKRLNEAARKRLSDPAVRAKHNAYQRKYRASMTAAQRDHERVMKRKLQATPAYRAKHNARMRKYRAAKRAAALR